MKLSNYTDQELKDKFIELALWFYDNSSFALPTHPNYTDYIDVYNLLERLKTELKQRGIYQIRGLTAAIDARRNDDR